MNQETTSQRTIAPPSPLNPYRKIIKENPIEDHFTNKRLRKHMRHHGLIPKPPTNENKELTSLEHDEHRIYNSGSQKYKRFRQKFLVAMADTVEEVDRARQAEFRKQLELWEKIYSNRIQRIQENDTTLQQKYALFIDKQIKKQLIQENLPKMPELPSLSMPQILPHFVRKRSKRRATSAKETNLPSDISHRQYTNKEHSYHQQIDQRLTQLENQFSQFQQQDFGDHRMNLNLLNMNEQLLTNDNNIIQDQFNEFNQQIQQLKNQLNDSIKDQQIFKIIQLKHQQNISQLTRLVKTLYEQFKNISNNKNQDEYLNNIQDKQQQFDDSLQTIVNNMETIHPSFIPTDNGINQINNNIIEQQQQIQNGINHNLNQLEQKLTTLQKQFHKTIHKTIKNIQTETTILRNKVDYLETNIHHTNLSHTNKTNTLPFVEKLPPMDLLEINWDKYHQQNQID